MRSRAFWSAVVVCACLPGAVRAQPVGSPAPLSGGQYLPPYPSAGGPDLGYPYGAGPLGPSRVAAFGFYVPRGFWSNGLSLYGPPVPTPGALPGVFGNYDLARQWRAFPLYGIGPYGLGGYGLGGYGFGGYGFGGYGFGNYSVGPYGAIGISVAGPRVRSPYAPPPVLEGLAGPAAPPAGAKVAGAVILSVRVPQPAAEVLVNGKRTTQTGTDRIFESPPLDAAETYTYVVTARWLERGQVIEMTRQVKGTPGEVVRVDFGR